MNIIGYMTVADRISCEDGGIAFVHRFVPTKGYPFIEVVDRKEAEKEIQRLKALLEGKGSSLGSED